MSGAGKSGSCTKAWLACCARRSQWCVAALGGGSGGTACSCTARRFKLSQDPAFAAKLRDVVGLYLDPPAHSLVPSVDEKSQIQALDRTQPDLPMKKSRAGTMTHDNLRHGTTTLFAEHSVLHGTVIGQSMARHRHHEVIRPQSDRGRRARRKAGLCHPR